MNCTLVLQEEDMPKRILPAIQAAKISTEHPAQKPSQLRLPALPSDHVPSPSGRTTSVTAMRPEPNSAVGIDRIQIDLYYTMNRLVCVVHSHHFLNSNSPKFVLRDPPFDSVSPDWIGVVH